MTRAGMFIGHLKQFLIENCGGEKIIFVLELDENTIGFGIRFMRLVLNCKDVSMHRVITTNDEGCSEYLNSFDDAISLKLERSFKEYIKDKTIGKTNREVFLDSMSFL